MRLTSSSIADGRGIPARHTCDGEDIAPDLAWSDLPPGTESLALGCFDPDAPGGIFTHWLMWNLDPALGALGEGEAAPGARQGRNDFGGHGYRGPCPPRGHGVHHYHFRLWALRAPLALADGADAKAFAAAVESCEIDRTELIGLYERR